MGRRSYNFTKEKHDRFLREGRGSGTGDEYKPWLTVFDLPSLGNSYRLRSYWTHNRESHCFSNLERDWFFIFDWAPNVVDIREQFPLLPLDETRELANKLKIKHPQYARKSEPYDIVLTSDFLLTIRKPDGELIQRVQTVKYGNALKNPRILEKFKLEEAFWQIRNIDWSICTNDYSRVLVNNISLLRGFCRLSDRIELSDQRLLDIGDYLNRELLGNTEQYPLLEFVNQSDKLFNLQPGSSLTIVYHLLANRVWKVDMYQPVHPHYYLSIRASHFA